MFWQLFGSLRQAKQRREAKRKWRKQRTTIAVFLRTFGALPEVHFLHSYTISKIRKSKIQRFKPCMIWILNEEDMAFGKQLHQVEGQFRTLRNWNSNVRNLKWMAAVKLRWSPACEVDFATCELGSQRAKVNSKLRNQLAKFSQVTMQRAKLWYLCWLFFFWYFCV